MYVKALAARGLGKYTLRLMSASGELTRAVGKIIQRPQRELKLVVDLKTLSSKFNA